MGSQAIPVAEVTLEFWVWPSALATVFGNISHATTGECFNRSAVEVCSDAAWCSFNENIGACVEHQNADWTCSHFSASTEMKMTPSHSYCGGESTDTFATLRCRPCFHFGLCVDSTAVCPQMCSDIIQHEQCEIPESQYGICRWTGDFCSSSVCFSFLQKGYEAMPILTFFFSVIKSSTVLLLWSAVSAAILLWWRRKRQGIDGYLETLTTDEKPMARRDSALASWLKVHREESFDGYIQKFVQSRMGIRQPSRQQLDLVAFALIGQGIVVSLDRSGDPIPEYFEDGVSDSDGNACVATAVQNDDEKSLKQASLNQLNAYFGRLKRECSSAIHHVCYIPSRKTAQRIEISIGTLPSTIMLICYVFGALSLLGISIAEAFLTLQQYDVLTKFHLVGFRMMNSTLMASFAMVASKWLRVTYYRYRSRPRKLCGRVLFGDDQLPTSTRLAVVGQQRLWAPHFLMATYSLVVMPMVALSFYGWYLYPLVPLGCFGAALAALVIRWALHKAITCIERQTNSGTTDRIDSSSDASECLTIREDEHSDFLLVEGGREEGSLEESLLSPVSPAGSFTISESTSRRRAARKAAALSATRAFVDFLTVDLMWATAFAIATQMGYNYAVMYIHSRQMRLDVANIPQIEWNARTIACLEYLFSNSVQEVASTISHRVQFISIVMPFI